MGRFLRIFFGCHARPDRSFYWKGKQFPICARCTGELAGMLAGIPCILFFGYFKVPVMILLMIPMIADGFLQLLTSYESKNGRRFVTGFLFGLAFDSILVYFHRACVMAAAELVKLFIRDGAAVDRPGICFYNETEGGVHPGGSFGANPFFKHPNTDPFPCLQQTGGQTWTV